MRLTRPTLDEAVTAGVLDAEQAAILWDFLQHQEPVSPRFKPAHILYYFGGLIAMGAIPLFMSLGWERLGGGAVAAGVVWQRHEAAIGERLRGFLPVALRGLIRG